MAFLRIPSFHGGVVILAFSPKADLNRFNFISPSSALPSGESEWAPQSSEFEIHRKNFTVKIANTRREFLQAYRLRYAVFHREFRGKQFPVGLDTDRYDRKAQLLVIIDNNIKKVVGTYRLINSRMSNDFYSSSEFKLDSFLDTPSVKVELSRACVHRNYRTGVVVQLLWRGLAEYINKVGAEFLFGCSSVQTTQLTSLNELYKTFVDSGAIQDQYTIAPLPRYRADNFEEWKKTFWDSGDFTPSGSEQLSLPPLLRSYLKAGAKVALEPALDKKYRCFDFLTILNVDNLTKHYVRKYSVS